MFTLITRRNKDITEYKYLGREFLICPAGCKDFIEAKERMIKEQNDYQFKGIVWDNVNYLILDERKEKWEPVYDYHDNMIANERGETFLQLNYKI